MDKDEAITEANKKLNDHLKLVTGEIDKITDLDLLILRGHILIEYTLNGYITDLAPNHGKFDDTKFTFAQKIELTYIFTTVEKLAMREELKLLNKLRNSLAHNLTYDPKLLDDFLNKMEVRINKGEAAGTFNPTDKLTALKHSILYLCGGLGYGRWGMKVYNDLGSYLRLAKWTSK